MARLALLAVAVLCCAMAGGVAAADAATASCDLRQGPFLSEGPVHAGASVPAHGEVKAVMLFVDFSDAPADERPSDLYQLLAPPADAYFRSVSYGRMSLSVRPLLTWLRMPKPSTAYGFADGDTLAEQAAYLREAIALADPRFDFHGAQEVYVVSSRGAALPVSPAFVGGPGVGLKADGTKLGFGATFGNDIRGPDGSYRYAPWILEHETGHTLGLPDLYRIPTDGDFHRAVGVWDPMDDLFRGTALMAWHRRKLGWLGAAQQVCLSTPGHSVTTTLAPLDRPGGRKLLAVRLDSAHAYSVEVRRPVGTDAGLCDSGVLISAIYGQRDTGKFPIVVQRAAPAPQGVDFDCGATAAAAFGVGPGEVSRFQKGRVTVQVLAADGDGYRVRATLRR